MLIQIFFHTVFIIFYFIAKLRPIFPSISSFEVPRDISAFLQFDFFQHRQTPSLSHTTSNGKGEKHGKGSRVENREWSHLCKEGPSLTSAAYTWRFHVNTQTEGREIIIRESFGFGGQQSPTVSEDKSMATSGWLLRAGCGLSLCMKEKLIRARMEDATFASLECHGWEDAGYQNVEG